MQNDNPSLLSNHRKLGTSLVVFGVAFNGLIIITTTLLSVIVSRNRSRILDVDVSISLFLGLTLIYLSRLLAKSKRTALIVAVPTYGIIFFINLSRYIVRHASGVYPLNWYGLLRNFIIPAIVVVGLILYRTEFTVKSDIRSFASSLKFIALILMIALVYGIVGFELLDTRDFHHEIGITEAVHRTVDQFDLTTNESLIPYTRRATIFLDSLSVISIGALGYGIISLFQPIRARFAEQGNNRSVMRLLLETYPASSEDFFKLWPHDKGYFISDSHRGGLAYHVHRGVALVVGDPAGDSSKFELLLDEFDELNYVNDWTPAFIHTEPKFSALYKSKGYTLQKIGEEAVLDLAHFENHVLNNKYFRHIKNKFEKTGYKTELLLPPHSSETVKRLHEISSEWLSQPGREERGFMMGYFTNSYIQQSPIMIAKDQNNKIQAFINQVHSFDREEANFDMLRHSKEGLGNINDFILINFINMVKSSGFLRLNLGLSPLSGLDKKQEDKSIVDSTLRFVYANGDRLYSFSGLHRFKSKYEPSWSDRYIAYRGGIAGFTRTISALNKVMNRKIHT